MCAHVCAPMKKMPNQKAQKPSRSGSATNLYLCAELKARAVALSLISGESLSDMAERGLRRILAEQSKKERRAAA